MHFNRRGLLALAALPAIALRAGAQRARSAFSSNPFTLGVASGDPSPDGFVLWTRLAPEPLAGGGLGDEEFDVRWEVAEDERFRRVVRSGVAVADPRLAHSVHVEVAGLSPDRWYWYRFGAGGDESPVGRARTMAGPESEPARLTFAFASCQHFETGYYTAFEHLAAEDPDLVLHLGDYIYEGSARPRVRAHQGGELTSLDDYRNRYALYRTDRDLQNAHAACPWIVTWDDHEVDNDYAADRSEHGDADGRFLARRAAAYQAYFEHQPLPRRMAPRGPHQRLYARQAFGDLAEIYLLDGRQYRSHQVCGDGLVSPCAALYDEQRTMLGRSQARWLDRRLRDSTARWNLLAQQTVFAHADQQPGEQVGYWNDGWSGYPAARQRLVDSVVRHGVANPVILSGDIHAFLANDVHARPGDPESPVVAAEFVTTSISSRGPSQSEMDRWSVENSNVRMARSDVRGYTRLTLGRDALRVDMVGIRDASRPDSGAYTLASHDVFAGEPGIAP